MSIRTENSCTESITHFAYHKVSFSGNELHRSEQKEKGTEINEGPA